MKTPTILMILLALGMVLCGGCANMHYSYYDGPRLPRTEVGMIKAGVISSIGEKEISYLAGHNIEVLPGSHTLGLSGTARTACGEKLDFHCDLPVEVEAGHAYEGFLDQGVSGGRETYVVGVTDKTANIVVASMQPHTSDSAPRFARLPFMAPLRLTGNPATGDRLAASF